MRAAYWVAAVGVLALLVTFGIALLAHGPRRSGTNYTAPAAFVTTLNPGQQACQAGEELPADTAAVQLTIDTHGRPGPPLTLAATGPAGHPLTQGGLPAGWRQGTVRIPVRRVRTATEGARVCVRVAAGPRASAIALAGNFDPGYAMEVAGQPLPGVRVRSTTCGRDANRGTSCCPRSPIGSRSRRPASCVTGSGWRRWRSCIATAFLATPHRAAERRGL